VRDAYGNVNSTATVSWSTTGGSISSSGVLTAQTTAATGKYVNATSGAASASVLVDIIAAAPASVTVSPGIAGVAAGGSASFTATVRDTYGNVNATAGVTWTTTAGSITTGGVLTAQTTAQTGRSVTATTTGSVAGSATVDVYAAAPSTVTVSPSTATLNTLATQQFTATVRDTYSNVNSTATVSWSATRGGITQGGLYTAPTTTGADTVAALSSGVTGTASVTVQKTIHITTMVSYKSNATSESFVKGVDTVEIRTTVVDHLGNAVSGASVTMQWLRPNGNLDHTDTLTTATNGTARAYYTLPNGASPGVWSGSVTALSGTNMVRTTDTTTTDTFSVTS
ncbi:MAG TPA: hypothetical protein VM370_09180, partial [Candidatus Thermoplasmatota archaeon]|nr:hypothetical protein [Candidatus Thermoplasmatota archaeon]